MAHYFITGASSGIGKALSIALASEGHVVSAVGRRIEHLKKIKSKHKNINIFRADVCDRLEIKNAIEHLGIEARCGLHLGNIEWRGEDISGIAVNIAARVMDIDKGNNIVVTKNLADVISGSDLKLKKFGQHRLKGIKDDLTLFKVSL